jgi:hypothetical protein
VKVVRSRPPVPLVSNHYHLVVETPNANLDAGMAWLQGACTIRLNSRHKLLGQGRVVPRVQTGPYIGGWRRNGNVRLRTLRASESKRKELYADRTKL